jgi:hypothetical protein
LGGPGLDMSSMRADNIYTMAARSKESRRPNLAVERKSQDSQRCKNRRLRPQDSLAQ